MVQAVTRYNQEQINLQSRTLGLLATQLYSYMGGDGPPKKLEAWLPYDLDAQRQNADPATADTIKRLWRARRIPLWVRSLLDEATK